MRFEWLRLFQLRSQKFPNKLLQPSVGSDVIGSKHVFFISIILTYITLAIYFHILIFKISLVRLYRSMESTLLPLSHRLSQCTDSYRYSILTDQKRSKHPLIIEENFLIFSLTLTRPIGLTPHTPVDQKFFYIKWCD